MASEGSGLSSDPSSAATAHFGQSSPEQVRGGPAAAPAVAEPEVPVETSGTTGLDSSQVEMIAATMAYGPRRTASRNRSASTSRASAASQRSARMRSRGVDDVRVGTAPCDSPASRTIAGGDGPVSPQLRLPDPSQASLTRAGGGGPLVDPYGADPNALGDQLQNRSPNPQIGETQALAGSSGSSVGPSASVARDELSEAATVTPGTPSTPPMATASAPPMTTTSTPTMLPTPSGPPLITLPAQPTDASTSSLASWTNVPVVSVPAGDVSIPLDADQRLEMEIQSGRTKRERAEAIETASKRGKSPAQRVPLPLGVGAPLNPNAPPLPAPVARDTKSFVEAIQHFDPGSVVAHPPHQVVLPLPTSSSSSQPMLPSTSFEEIYKIMLANNKAKDERIGVLEESKRDLERQAVAAANVAAAASSHAATVETTARAATQQVLTGHARVESELAAAERRVEELERQRGDFQQLAAHMNQRYQEMKTEYEKVVQQLGLANAKGQNPSSCPECPRKQLAIEQSAVQIQTLSTEIAGLRGRLGILSAAVSSWEEKYNVEISQNAQLSREAADARNAVTRLTRQRDETAESLNLSQASLAEATAKVTTLQSRLGDAEARAARAAAEVMVYKDLPENVSALQQRFVDQRQQAQAVVDHLSESKNALAVQLTELQTYAQSLNNSITEKME